MKVNLQMFLLLFIFNFILMQTEFVESDSAGSGNNSEELFETQHTICQINTLQLAATAKATVTRALKGVCLSKYMDEHFKKVEKLVKNQLELMKQIETKIDSVTSDRTWRFGHLSENLVITTTAPWGDEDFNAKLDEEEEKPLPRDLEIKQFNGTVYQDNKRKSIFTYYWKIEKIEEKLLQRKSIRSSRFYITPGGYCMYMRVFPMQNSETIYIQAGLTHGNFDETLLWPFRLKHRLTLLDQNMINYIDIQSRIWDPAILCSDRHWQKPHVKNDNYECIGLAISNDTMHSRSYLKSSSLIIKLTVYLE